MGAAAVDGSALAALLDAARHALAGTGPALLPVAADAGTALREAVGRAQDVPPRPGTALVLPTSGSTGRPRLVELGADALRASAEATHARLGGPGRWLLALPLTHVAGWQVVVRSLLAGAEPAVLGAPHRGGPAGPAVARALADGSVRYASLVPTQLAGLLDDAEATAALAGLDAVLLGGAATAEALRRRAVDAGVPVVRTYGMTETCGGCVYDEVPLDGVRATTEDGGRLLLAGPVLASGHLGEQVPGAFVERDGTRWLRTGDRATVDRAGRVRVTGRMDDQIVSGGVNVTPADVEDVMASMPGVRDVVVVGVPDPRWGQAVVAVVAGDERALPGLAAVRATVADRLGAAAAPRRLVVVAAVPHRGIGKPDRSAAARLAAATPLGPEQA